MKLRLFCRLSSSAQTMIANHWLGRDSHCEWDHWFCPSIVTTVAVCNNQWMSFLGSADTFQYTKVLASTRLGWDLVHGCLVVGSVSTMCTSLYLQWVLGCDTVDGCLVVGSGLWHRLWHRHGSKDRWPDALHWFRLPAQIHPPDDPFIPSQTSSEIKMSRTPFTRQLVPLHMSYSLLCSRKDNPRKNGIIVDMSTMIPFWNSKFNTRSLGALRAPTSRL